MKLKHKCNYENATNDQEFKTKHVNNGNKMVAGEQNCNCRVFNLVLKLHAEGDLSTSWGKDSMSESNLAPVDDGGGGDKQSVGVVVSEQRVERRSEGLEEVQSENTVSTVHPIMVGEASPVEEVVSKQSKPLYSAIV